MLHQVIHSLNCLIRTRIWQLAVVGLWLFSLFILQFRLEELPAESWADVAENQRLAQYVFNSSFFWEYRFGGDGPVLPYLAAALGWLQGTVTYQTMKVATAMIGSTLAVAAALVMLELLDKVVRAIPMGQSSPGRWASVFRFVLLRYQRLVSIWVGLLAATWFWPVVLSRQGKPYALAMVLVAWLIWFVLKKSWWRVGSLLALSSFSQVSALGLWLLVPVVQPLALIVAIPATIPLFYQWFIDHTLTSEYSHLGPKLGLSSLSVIDRLVRYGHNFWLNISSLWLQGDRVVYQNINHGAHLDPISGIFVLLGIGVVGWLVWRWSRLWRSAGILLWGLVILQLPAMLDVVVGNTPNAGRLAVWVSLLVCLAGFGVLSIVTLLVVSWGFKPWTDRAIVAIFAFTALLIMSYNSYEYFWLYPTTLPSQNQRVSLAVVDFLEGQLYGRTVLVHQCCWHDGAQPQPWIIGLEIEPRRDFVQIDTTEDIDRWLRYQCREKNDAFVVLHPDLSTLNQWQGKAKLERLEAPQVGKHGPAAGLYYLP